MKDSNRSGVDPRLDRLLDEAALVERQRPRADASVFLRRLRPQLAAEAGQLGRPGRGWSIQATAIGSLAAAGVLALVLFLVFRQPADDLAPSKVATTPPEDSVTEEFLVDNLDALERLADVLAEDLASGELDLEAYDDLDLIQDTNLESLLAGLMEETG